MDCRAYSRFRNEAMPGGQLMALNKGGWGEDAGREPNIRKYKGPWPAAMLREARGLGNALAKQEASWNCG